MKPSLLSRLIIPKKQLDDKDLAYALGQNVAIGVPSTFIMAVFSILFYRMDAQKLFLVNNLWFIASVFCFTSMRFGFHRMARITYTVAMYAGLTAENVLLGERSFLWVHILLGLANADFIFTPKEKNLRRFSQVSCVICLLLCLYFQISGMIPVDVVPRYQQGVIYFGMFSVLYATIVVMLSNMKFQSDARRQEEIVENKSLTMLQQAKMSTLGEMAAGVAHEINNPLGIIIGKIEGLESRMKQKAVDEDKFLRDFSKIKEVVTRIAKIVSALRTFARTAENEPFQKVKASEIFEQILDLYGENLSQHQIQVKISGSQDAVLLCNSTQILQVMAALFSNSLDAIKDLPEKWIHIDSNLLNDRMLRISVTDSGPGIPKNIAEKIMQPFFTTKEIGKGTGLGLSISKGIVENHHGQLSLDSTKSNTCFVIELPVVDAVKNSVAA